jgi:hypothetical protein
MKYKVTIELFLPPTDENKYGQEETIYTQKVEELDLNAVIKAINGFTV